MRELETIKGLVQRKSIPNLWMWFGDERFLLQEGLEILINHYRQIDPSGSNVERISAKQYTPQEIIDKAYNCSFFSNLIVVDEVTYFQDNSFDLEPIFGYINNPNPGTCLLFITESVHKGKRLYKELAKRGAVLEFTVPKRWAEWQEWVKNEVEKRGKRIDAKTSAFLVDWVGHQPGILSQELDKLSLSIEGRAQITIADIERNVPRTLEASIFDLLDALAKGNSAKAVNFLREILCQEHPLKILTLITRQMRLLLGAKTAQEKRLDQEQMAAILGIKPYEAQKIWQQAQIFLKDTLIKGLNECLQIERSIKMGRGDADDLLEIFIVKFCNREM